jgi:diadenosine tetraphosphate (Ap4A) HIT family hydrolase
VAELDSRLAADTQSLGETPDCWIRWMNDQRFAWLVIVPKREDVREWYELESSLQHDLLDLVNRCALNLQSLTGALKMNIGALGNIVPQLHVHIIARHEADACWPGPVWGNGAVEPYSDGDEPVWLGAMRQRLSYRCA